MCNTFTLDLFALRDFHLNDNQTSPVFTNTDISTKFGRNNYRRRILIIQFCLLYPSPDLPAVYCSGIAALCSSSPFGSSSTYIPNTTVLVLLADSSSATVSSLSRYWASMIGLPGMDSSVALHITLWRYRKLREGF